MRIRGLSKGRPAVKLWWLFFLLALISGAMALFTQFFASELFGWASTVHRERREIEVWGKISISALDIPLEVYTYKGEKIIVEYTGETALFIEEGEFELKVGRDEDFTLSLFTADKLNYKMTVWLPEQAYKEIELKTTSGDIYAENIKTEFINITSRSGNVHLYGIDGLIAVSTRFGDVEAEFIRFTDSCAIDTETGAVNVIIPSRFGVRLDFLTDTGSFTSDFFRKEYNEHSGDLYLSAGDNPVRFTVRTISGNLVFITREEEIK